MLNTTEWNKRGRAVFGTVSKILENIIAHNKPGEAFPEDDREPELADAVLAEVVALNAAGKWKEARTRFDPAHTPFVHHMEDMDLAGITQAIFLGPDAFLVRLGDDTQDVKVLHIDGDRIEEMPGVVGFCISRNRRSIALATNDGVLVHEGWKGRQIARMGWPELETICPWRMSVSDDGCTVTLGNDEAGLWLARKLDSGEPRWLKLAPRQNLVSDDDEEDESIDVLHSVVSPDGNYVAIGWQDAPGHVIEKIAKELAPLERWAVVEPKSDYPYHVLFTDDSKSAFFNSRHMQNGMTVYASLSSLKGLEPYGDLPDDAAHTDEYLRAYDMVLLPKEVESRKEPTLWIGGQGWSHAAPISGGKPVFTQMFGSSLNAFDYDPISRRALVGSSSGMLHVLDPFTRAEAGTEQGYQPRRELYRWIFWESLKQPIRW